MDDSVCAVAVFGGPSVWGTVKFHEASIDGKRAVVVNVRIRGLPRPGQEHGLHIHEAGDLTESSCASACAHFNPHQEIHGGRHSARRHVGDLGNIRADARGWCSVQFFDAHIGLRGPHSIIGRSVVVHAKRDDLGLGGGAREACAVVGYAREMFRAREE